MIWPLTARALAQIVGGELRGSPDAVGERLLTDSRSGVRSGDVFFGLDGPHFEGGRFAQSTLDEGATIAVVRDPLPEDLRRDQAVLRVPDPLAALQALAAEARRRFSGRVLAITGSNGKTTVKDMLAAALGTSRRVDASPRSYNSQVGVPLSILGMNPAAQVAILECGIDSPGEMARLARLVAPDFGIFTNVGDAHLEGFGSRPRIAREKAELFRGMDEGGWVLTGAGEGLAIEALKGLELPVKTLGSPAEPSPYRLTTAGGAAFLEAPETSIELEVEAPSAPLLQDAALAATAALLLGGDPRQIAEGLRLWRPAPMRLELSTTSRGILLINDAYTADPLSMESALQTLQQERSGGQAVAVLGGMAQLGQASRGAHRKVGRRVYELALDRLVGVGAGGRQIAGAALEAGMPAERVHIVSNAGEASIILEEHCEAGDRVLLKASRPERLEAIAATLFDAVSPARLYVDLDALLANYRGIRRRLDPGCGVMAVVKSFGYGLDAVRVARALERAGIEYLAVAYPDEGAQLRRSGITTPILVQNLLEMEAEKIVRHGLTAQISSSQQISWLEAEASAQRRAVRVHLKVDTGMARSGAAVSDAAALARLAAASPWLTLEGLMTHFAAAEDPAQDAFTRGQIRRFQEAEAHLSALGLVPRWRHACNSAGLARFPQAHGTMVRAGLALFGYCRFEKAAALEQHPALRLVSHVISVRRIEGGQPLGYGLTYRAPRDGRTIALVALGYNDGYPWSLSNRGWMAVQGHRCPVVGRISMDVTSIDVTEVGGGVAPGDEVTVFGPGPEDPSLGELAELAGTIPYELLTRISHRVRRIFRTSE